MNPSTVFVQLPVLSHDFLYNLEHVPLGSGCVLSYVAKKLPYINAIRLEQEIEAVGCDALILEEILASNPARVCFSVYLWNIERSLELSKRIKQREKEIEIVVGGPEVSRDNGFLLAHSHIFDAAIQGEGEEALVQYLLSPEEKGIIPRKEVPLPLEEIPSPYLNHVIGPSIRGRLLLESVRGCPNHCLYCYYHKNFSSIRTLPSNLVRREIEWALGEGVKEVTFVDPSFLKRPRIKEFLREIGSVLKGSNVSLTCELNAEDVDKETADMLVLCNTSQVEIGLQSINPAALKAVSRRFDKEAFIQGVRLLREVGIEVMIDLIVGLPGDSKEDVMRSIDFLVEQRLFDELGIYPLSVLPGTSLKDMAPSLGILHQDLPPYLVLGTPSLGREEIRDCMQYAEEATDIDLYPVEFPLFPGRDIREGTLIYELIPTQGKEGTSVSKILCRLLSSIIITIKEEWLLRHSSHLLTLMDHLLGENPHLLIDVIIDADIVRGPEEVQATCRKLLSLSLKERQYMDRDPYSTTNLLRSLQFFVFMQRGESMCLMNLPVDWIKTGARSQFWFKIRGEEEDFFLEKGASLVGEPLLAFNVVDAPLSEDIPISMGAVKVRI